MNRETLVERANQAFTIGYPTESSRGQSLVHSLWDDAKAIADAFGETNNGESSAVWEAMVYGLKPEPYEDSERALGELTHSSDTVVIWTQGDRVAQFYKVRNLDWEEALRNPTDPGNFRIVASREKVPLMDAVASYGKSRQASTLLVLEDNPKHLVSVHDRIEDEHSEHYDGLNVRYVYINRSGKPSENLPDYVTEITSLDQYTELAETIRQDGNTIIHALDLDNTLIDQKATERIRRESVVSTLVDGTENERRLRPVFHRFNGFHAIDRDGHFHRLTGGRMSSPDFAGHQADIYFAGDFLVKAFARKSAQRPKTADWQEMGGYRGAKELAADLKKYRERLADLGFRVPGDYEFLPARMENGEFIVLEVVENLGESLQNTFINGTDDERRTLTRAILEQSHVVLTTEGIGADIKPANFVVNSQEELVHIDPLPMIVVDDHGRVNTEWPRIDAPQIQDFLYKAYLTEEAIGFRFYQELCLIDPSHRTLYRDVIMDVVTGWEKDGRIKEGAAQKILDAVRPETTRLLEGVLDTSIRPEDGLNQIVTHIDSYADRFEHPIYALREMSYLLSERILHDGIPMKETISFAIGLVEDRLGGDVAARVLKSVEEVPEDLGFLTVVRKLTHLSSKDWRAGREEQTALYVIGKVAQKVMEYGHTTAVS